MSDQPDSRPVVFLHPAGLDTHCGDQLGWPGLVSPTLAGHEGVALEQRVSVSMMAAEVALRLDAPAHVVGCSLGGMVAQDLAINHPELVRSLVLVATTANPPNDVMRQRADWTETAPREEMVEETLARWFSSESLGRRTPSPGLAYARDRLHSIDARSFAAVWRAIADHDARSGLSQVGVPVTCVAGSGDVSTPPQLLRELSTLVPVGRYCELDWPHLGLLDDPASFRRLLADHLRWCADLTIDFPGSAGSAS